MEEWITLVKLKTAFLIWFLLPGQGLSEGAFGIDFGSQLSALLPLAEVDGLYELEPKTPSKSFERYAVIYEPSLGVCKITANTLEYSDDRFGKNALQVYNLVKDELTQIYGLGSQYEFMSDDADLDDDDEFALAIYKKARMHSTHWTIEQSDTFNVTANVSLGVRAIKNMTWVNVSYEANFFSQCMDKISSQSN